MLSLSSQSVLWLCSAVGIDPACSLEREAILNFQHPLTDELLVKEGHPVQLHVAGERGKLWLAPVLPHLHMCLPRNILHYSHFTVNCINTLARCKFLYSPKWVTPEQLQWIADNLGEKYNTDVPNSKISTMISNIYTHASCIRAPSTLQEVK